MLSAVLVFVIVIGGAIGLFLAMPGGRRGAARLALLPLAAAAGALVALAGRHLAGGATAAWFTILALIGLAGAVRMITHPRPVYSALYFVLVAVAVVGLLVLLEAAFLAWAVVLIYAGAILVTYIFVIMLAQQEGTAPYDTQAREALLGVLAGFTLLAVLTAMLFLASPAPEETAAIGPPAPPGPAPAPAAGSVRAVAAVLLTNYMVAVQAAGILLLAAMVGAIAVARRKVSPAGTEELD